MLGEAIEQQSCSEGDDWGEEGAVHFRPWTTESEMFTYLEVVERAAITVGILVHMQK